MRKPFKQIWKAVQKRQVRLPFAQNSLRVRFVSLDLSQADHNRYRYKLGNAQNDWIDLGKTHELSLFSLSPGTYELLVDGSDRNGNWSQQPAQLRIEILPPFWRSPLAYVLYVCLLFLIIYTFYRIRLHNKIRKLKEEARLQQALVEEREQLRQENAADFHDELGNKITKISLFLELAERSLHNQQSPDSWLKQIRNNVVELASGFKDLLWVIDPHNDSIFDTFIRLKEFGEDLFENTEVAFRSIGLKEEFRQYELGPQNRKQVVMIFKEAMNNSLKYARASNVSLKIEKEASFARISLLDDGAGFEIDSGNGGRGLVNMKRRSDLIGAAISVNSQPGKGTQIVLGKIPLISGNSEKEK